MRVGDVLRFFVREVINAHSNHSRLFFFDVHELNQTFLTALVEIPFGGTICFILIEDILDMILPKFKLVVLHNVEWALDSSTISAEFNFSSREVTHD